MAKYYSPSERGFFSKDIHGTNMPADIIELSDDEWKELLSAQAAGKSIQPGVHGGPIAAERVPSLEECKTQLLMLRDQALSGTDWLVARHRDELEVRSQTTLTAEQYTALQRWRAQLRALPAHPDFPRVALPPKPLA